MQNLANTNFARPQLAFFPEAPVELPKLDIPESVSADIMLRRLYMEGQSNLQSLKQSLHLSFPLVSALFQKLRQQQLLEVTGMEGSNYFFTLTTAGREFTEKRLKTSQYSGPAPVSLESYYAAVRAQVAEVRLNRHVLREALSDLVLSDRFLDQLGPALVSQTSLFLYGPTGNGKTSIAVRLPRIYDDLVFIPYAIESDGQIILVYDPAVHQQAEGGVNGYDPRWVLCRRPCITVGGELDLSMLELRRDQESGTYAAPPQMKANNGIFIIDDFGRQIASPQVLLNRWILPLDQRVDYLTLSYGVKFQIPFELMVVFATNLDPAELSDEAFLRRIRNKVYVEPVEDANFDEIVHRLLAERTLSCDAETLEALRSLCRTHSSTNELRACYPADFMDILTSISAYQERPLEITKDGLEWAAAIYFSRK
jgi:hypothetical protein